MRTRDAGNLFLGGTWVSRMSFFPLGEGSINHLEDRGRVRLLRVGIFFGRFQVLLWFYWYMIAYSLAYDKKRMAVWLKVKRHQIERPVLSTFYHTIKLTFIFCCKCYKALVDNALLLLSFCRRLRSSSCSSPVGNLEKEKKGCQTVRAPSNCTQLCALICLDLFLSSRTYVQ